MYFIYFCNSMLFKFMSLNCLFFFLFFLYAEGVVKCYMNKASFNYSVIRVVHLAPNYRLLFLTWTSSACRWSQCLPGNWSTITNRTQVTTLEPTTTSRNRTPLQPLAILPSVPYNTSRSDMLARTHTHRHT